MAMAMVMAVVMMAMQAGWRGLNDRVQKRTKERVDNCWGAHFGARQSLLRRAGVGQGLALGVRAVKPTWGLSRVA